MPIHRRALFHLDVVLRAASLQQQMLAAWRDERGTWNDAIVVLCLAYVDLTQTVQARRERPGKRRRHVLNDHDTRGHRRQLGQHMLQRLRAAGGCTDRDHTFRRPRHRLLAGRSEDDVG